MNINLHILNASESLTPFIEDIKRIFDQSIKKITSRIPISGVDAVVYDNPDSAIPEIGIGGYAPNRHLIWISIDPAFPNLAQSIEKELGRTLAHELHHALRWKGPGYGKTLFEALITEGLADHFDMEVSNDQPHIWDTVLSNEFIQKYLELAKKEFNNEDYKHSDWFFGSKERDIPKWTGYSLGFYLVREYLRKNPKEKASSLYSQKAADFE